MGFVLVSVLWPGFCWFSGFVGAIRVAWFGSHVSVDLALLACLVLIRGVWFGF